MSYDDLDRLVGVTAGSAQGGNAVFAYDVLDNIRQLDQGTRTVRHTYNTSNRISAIKDAAGNTLSTYVQDTRGNLVQRITGAVTDTFTFDKANRLKATSINGVASTYRYDGQGRRMQQTEAGVSSYFVYGQAGQLLFSQDGVNRYNHIHLAGSLVAKRLVPFDGSATKIRYQHTDALGSPVAETNEAGVLYLPRERLTAYGEPADGTWQAGPGFTGHQMDASSKLVYMQQRYYDPISGTFLSADPVRTYPNTGAIFNRYSYALGNPYRFVDPDGRLVQRTPWGDDPLNRRILEDWQCANVCLERTGAEEGRKKYGKGTKSKGHHWVPFGSLDEDDVSPEARMVFGQSVSGEKLSKDDHLVGHHDYTNAVKGEFRAWTRENGIDPSRMSAEQASSFVRHIRSSSNPAISNLVNRVNMATEKLRALGMLGRVLVWAGMVDFANSQMTPHMDACKADRSSCAAVESNGSANK